MALTLGSSVFTQGGEIPPRYTCEGENISPPLEWSGIPEAARSMVLIVEDPDAPDPKAPTVTWVHWVLINIPTTTTTLAEGASSKNLPSGSEEGLNDWNNSCYEGACPPIGRHRYFHKLYALDATLTGMTRPTKAVVEAAMKGHVIAEATLMGTYVKSS